MSEQVEQAREALTYSVAPGRRMERFDRALDALIAAVRAETLHQMEQEATRRADECQRVAIYSAAYSLKGLADWCQAQREGR